MKLVDEFKAFAMRGNVIKMMNAAKKKEEAAPAAPPAPPAPTNEELLLTEIRDLLKKK